LKLGGQTLEIKSAANGILWKNMLPFSVREGVIYSDDSVEVQCSVQVIKFLERL
jgi:hypothetical protein